MIEIQFLHLSVLFFMMPYISLIYWKHKNALLGYCIGKSALEKHMVVGMTDTVAALVSFSS